MKLKISREKQRLYDVKGNQFFCKAYAHPLTPEMCRGRRLVNSCGLCDNTCEQAQIMDELFPQKLMLRKKK